MLQLLLPELLFDVQTERDGTFVLLAVFGMVTAKRDELLADGTATIRLPLAAFCVLNDTLHLLAGRKRAVGIATLTCMDQRLDAALDAETTRVSWALGSCCCLVVAVVVQSKPQLIHLVLVTFNIVAGDAQVIVLEKERRKKRDKNMNMGVIAGLTILVYTSSFQPFPTAT